MSEQGSLKHFLDWTNKSKTEFSKELSDLLSPAGAIVTEDNHWMPRGYEHPKEAKIGELNSEFLPLDIQTKIVDWWLAKKRGANGRYTTRWYSSGGKGR